MTAFSVLTLVVALLCGVAGLLILASFRAPPIRKGRMAGRTVLCAGFLLQSSSLAWVWWTGDLSGLSAVALFGLLLIALGTAAIWADINTWLKRA